MDTHIAARPTYAERGVADEDREDDGADGVHDLPVRLEVDHHAGQRHAHRLQDGWVDGWVDA